MARKLSPKTLTRLKNKLLEEEQRLMTAIEDLETEREQMRLAESSADHAPDPENAEGGSLALDLEMEVSKQRNAEELLAKVRHALDRMEQGTYGVCEVSGDPIPVARLDALPYATTTVEWAHRV